MSKSHLLFKDAQKYILGGVNSPVRAFRSVGGNPIFFKKGEGAYLYDEDGCQYIDYVNSWGAMIVGHTHPNVIEAIIETAKNGLSFGAPTALETELARRVIEKHPSIDLIRMVNSGTEATMSAIRLARGFTKRDKLIKFEGCYHGHSDALLVKAGSGLLTFGQPSSSGIPENFTKDTLVLPFNDIETLKDVFQKIGHEIACVIVEPIAGNMNCIPPIPGFLEAIKQCCSQYESVFIMDEVMTGFRVHQGSAQGLYDIDPDLTTFGKIIGGGMPVGAFGGKAKIMNHLSPIGDVYQAGTLSGNPVAMAAGIATLQILDQPGFYQDLSDKTTYLMQGLKNVFDEFNQKFTTNHVCAMFGLFFTDEKVNTYAQALKSNVELFNQFFHGMLEEGIYLAPSAFEAGFISTKHTYADLDKTIEATRKVASRLK